MTALTQPMRAQEVGDGIVHSLVEEGFENVRWAQDGKEYIFTFDTNQYATKAKGIAQAVQLIQQAGVLDTNLCRVIVTQQDIPQVTLLHRPGGEWDVTYELTDDWKQVNRCKNHNSSLGKVNLSIEPKLYFKNLIINQIYQYVFNLAPTIEVSLWPGAQLMGQVILPVFNDGYKWPMNYVRPGLLTLTQRVRLPYNIQGQFTVGTFTDEVYGLDVDVKYPLKDERFLLEGRYGWVGYGRWERFKFYYPGENTHYWSVGGDFFWPRYNTTFKLRAERYLAKDVGVRFDMVRHFKHGSIGLYAQKSDKCIANGGFIFYVTIPPVKKMSTKYVRIGMRGTGVQYVASNERVGYMMPFTDGLSDNQVKYNEFNPVYLKSVINDY